MKQSVCTPKERIIERNNSHGAATRKNRVDAVHDAVLEAGSDPKYRMRKAISRFRPQVLIIMCSFAARVAHRMSQSMVYALISKQPAERSTPLAGIFHTFYRQIPQFKGTGSKPSNPNGML